MMLDRARSSQTEAWPSWRAHACLLAVLCFACGEEVHVRLLRPIQEPLAPIDDAPSNSTGSTEPSSLPTPTLLPTSTATDSAAAQHDAGDDVPGPPRSDSGLTSNDAGRQIEAGPQAIDASLAAPDSVLLHHYDFSGNGVEVVDRVAAANGVLVGGAELDGAGGVTLDGEDDYVDLPNHMLSELSAVTFVASLTWNGGGCWQRVFDFGSSTDGEDLASNAETSFFITPASCPISHNGPVTLGVVSAMFHVDTSAHTLQHDSGLVEGERAQLAVSAATSGLTIFVDGQLVGHLDAPLVVAEIDDVNAWLGRSQWRQDPTLAATLFDFRIYGAALSGEQIATVYRESFDAP